MEASTRMQLANLEGMLRLRWLIAWERAILVIDGKGNTFLADVCLSGLGLGLAINCQKHLSKLMALIL